MDNISFENCGAIGVAAGVASAPGALSGVAIAMSEQLQDIGSVYGDECLCYVKHRLVSSSDPSWEEVVYTAVKQWTMAHPRLVLDLA